LTVPSGPASCPAAAPPVIRVVSRSSSGFAAMLKFYEIEGRFPAYREEVPPAVVRYLTRLDLDTRLDLTAA